MHSRSLPSNIKLLNARASTGVDKTGGVSVEDFRNSIFSLATDGGGTASFTVQFQGSVSETAPDFSAAQSVTNHWDYIEVVDMEDGTVIDGDTGVAVAVADDYRLFEANVNGLRWVNAIITTYVAGGITVDFVPFTNQ